MVIGVDAGTATTDAPHEEDTAETALNCAAPDAAAIPIDTTDDSTRADVALSTDVATKADDAAELAVYSAVASAGDADADVATAVATSVAASLISDNNDEDPLPVGAPEVTVVVAPPTPLAQTLGEIPAVGRMLAVHVTDAGGRAVTIRVHVVAEDAPKPFLGGFRDRRSGLEYHHAASQTYRKPGRAHDVPLLTRETQTKFVATKRTMTTVAAATQMTTSGVFVSDQGDKELAPTVYETADAFWARVTRHVIVLQSYFRRWRARLYVADLRHRAETYRRYVAQEEQARRDGLAAELDARVTRRLNPKNDRDFELLYHGLDMWRQEEAERLNDNTTSTARQQAQLALLKQQAIHLSTIDQMRALNSKDKRQARIQEFFRKTGEPFEWTSGPENKLVVMDTAHKQRGRELAEIYHALQNEDVTAQHRLDVLVHARLVVQEHRSQLCTDILELLQREGDLISRKTSPGVFEGLRRRLLNLFLQFCETPEFNPEAARFLLVHQPPEAMRKGFRKCAGCARCLPVADFAVSFASSGFGKCSKCLRLENLTLARSDGTHHERILCAVQKSELALDPTSKCAFALSVADMRFLLESVWGCKSCLSQEADLARLVLVRWRRAEQWAPWNCVLVTAAEAHAHSGVTTPDNVYGPALTAAVTRRHLQAKAKFSQLAKQFATGA